MDFIKKIKSLSKRKLLICVLGLIAGFAVLLAIWIPMKKNLQTNDKEVNSEKTNGKEIGEESESSENIIEKQDREMISDEDLQEIIQGASGEEKAILEEENIACSAFSRFSGQFVEDGSDELVENIAAILVTNQSEQFLDLCTLQYEIEGKEATFIVTGLPAGRSAWVMEKSGMTISDGANFDYQGCVTSFRDEVVATTDKITISSEGNMLTAVNNTQETLKGVFIYYKVLHTDGNFFGGITYLIDFGDIEPGEAVEKVAGHYVEEKTEIVRIGWQDS